MYIWIAIDVNEQVRELREFAENYVNKHGLTSPALTLPFHISLKISFQIPNDKRQEIICDIRDFCRTLKPFTIPVGGLEKNDTIIWLTMQECDDLNLIHDDLDELLLKKYGVVQHTFDKSFIFHTSVLIMNNEERLCNAYEAINGTPIPNELKAEKIIIGSSMNGQAGTYTVNEEIML
jgi:2'-5' RNA ligase